MKALSKDGSVLAQIAAHKREEVLHRKTERPLVHWQEDVARLDPEKNLEAALRTFSKKPKLILEIKPGSPSQGLMRADLTSELPEILGYYQRFGTAISVLTDNAFFGGSLELLESVTRQTSRPVLCKEFILDPYQVYEARKAGAASVLLIVKMLADTDLKTLHQLIIGLGMTPLVEIQNESELTRALPLSPRAILINHRNLDTLQLDMATVERLAPSIPKSCLCVGASGLTKRLELERLSPFCDAFLVGSALMKLPLPEWEALLLDWHETVGAARL